MQRTARVRFTDDLGTGHVAGIATALFTNPQVGEVLPVGLTTYRDDDPSEDAQIETSRTEIVVVREWSPRASRYVPRYEIAVSGYTAIAEDRIQRYATVGDALTALLNDTIRARRSRAILAAREA